MGEAQIREVQMQARVKSAELNERLVKGHVHQLQNIYAELNPSARRKSPKFFYRQAEVAQEPERWNIEGRERMWQSCVYFASASAGEELFADQDSFRAWLRSQNKITVFRPCRDLLTVEAETSRLLIDARLSFWTGKTKETRSLLATIAANTAEMLRALDKEEHGK